MGKVYISSNPVKSTERIDFGGNIIDPKTKQVLVPREVDSVLPPITPPQATQAPVASPVIEGDGLSVLQQIQATKQKLQELEELKKLKIAQKKAELELLQQ